MLKMTYKLLIAGSVLCPDHAGYIFYELTPDPTALLAALYLTAPIS